jgi:hypothetical protein
LEPTINRRRRCGVKPVTEGLDVTLVWFVMWLIANNVGGSEPLDAAPVNARARTLILAIALDLSAAHATRGRGA